jgi:hypothetical protein
MLVTEFRFLISPVLPHAVTYFLQFNISVPDFFTTLPKLASTRSWF